MGLKRFYFALVIVFFGGVGAVLGASPVTEMLPRDAPVGSARPAAKSFDSVIAAAHRVQLVPFPAPTAAELFERSAKRGPDREWLSFGREPMALGLDGRVTVPSGVTLVRIDVTSRTAMHLRSAWRFEDDAAYEVTVFSGGALTMPLTNRSGTSMNGDRRLIWSAITQGERQEVLIERMGPASGSWHVALERVSHFDTDWSNDPHAFRPKGLGDSASCQSDIACLIDVLSPADGAVVLGASRGVAIMLLTKANGATSFCTGTLLNSAGYPRPLFVTAYHCIDDAVTFDTLWFFSRAFCGFGPVSTATQHTGGANTLWSSRALDAALLELHTLPPPNASYAGWNSASITSRTDLLAIHHPRGDVKKASFGEVYGLNTTPVTISNLGTYPAGTFYMVDWGLGIVEPGSSGSGFFTLTPTANALQLRGTLTGGRTSCGTGPSRTYYQRFDYIYQFIANEMNAPPQPPPPSMTSTAVEYFHSSFGHFFITAASAEIGALDAGQFAGWSRTGQTFKVYPLNTAGASNVCRFFSTSFAPKSSHFYTPFAAECGSVRQNRDWQFEAEVFAMKVPDAVGSCAAGTVPLYRLYNNGRSGAPNHRYVASMSVRSQMLSQGWISEGYGAQGVIGCVPQ